MKYHKYFPPKTTTDMNIKASLSIHIQVKMSEITENRYFSILYIESQKFLELNVLKNEYV